MGNLAVDTHVEGGDGNYRAELSEDWRVWGPQGGYIASIALRAAGAESGRPRPASISAQFCKVGAFAPVDVHARILRQTRVASMVDVEIHQDGALLLKAAVWGVDHLDGLEHQSIDRPDPLPEPESIPSTSERMADDTGPTYPFWENLDNRSPIWIEDWENREAMEPVRGEWFRFLPEHRFDDPWVDACRSLVLLDVGAWPVAVLPHVGELDYFAPTTEVTARFIGDGRNDEWLASWAKAPVASNGLIGATGEIWSADHRLLALGGSTLLCRPATRRPD
ncbi:MAG: acyl-CoA thioesterase [Acidimicrobiales bacterium]